MKKLLLICGLLLATGQCFAQSKAANDHVRILLELTGSAKMGMQIMEKMLVSYREAMPKVPDQFWDEFAKEINQDALIDMIVPIYTKHFTDAEILELIAFYRTPLGRKMTDKLPLISQDAYAAGRIWGEKIAEQAMKKLEERSYFN